MAMAKPSNVNECSNFLSYLIKRTSGIIIQLYSQYITSATHTGFGHEISPRALMTKWPELVLFVRDSNFLRKIVPEIHLKYFSFFYKPSDVPYSTEHLTSDQSSHSSR